MPDNAAEDEEVAALRARIAVLEAQLLAKPIIGRGELYALSDDMPWGVLSLGAEGQVIYANPAFSPWLGEDGEVAASIRPMLEPLIARALDGAKVRGSVTARHRDGSSRELQIIATPQVARPGQTPGCVVILHDATEAGITDAALLEHRQRLELALEGSGVGLYDLDLGTGSGVWSASAFETLGLAYDPPAATYATWRARIHPDDIEAMEAEHAAAAAAGGRWQTRYRVIRADTGEVRWLAAFGQFVKRPGRAPRSIGVVVDVTDQTRAEAEAAERQAVLLNELNHRVKNTLATVQSFAHQTFRGGPSSGEVDAFLARLMALSSAHDVLTQRQWEDACVREVVERALRPFASAEPARLKAEGTDFGIDARTALALSLALHELATNAVKHGALSNDTGRIEVRWTADGNGLSLTWRESGGPPVAQPIAPGFGTRLLLEGLKRELGAEVAMDFAEAGVAFDLRTPPSPDPGRYRPGAASPTTETRSP